MLSGVMELEEMPCWRRPSLLPRFARVFHPAFGKLFFLEIVVNSQVKGCLRSPTPAATLAGRDLGSPSDAILDPALLCTEVLLPSPRARSSSYRSILVSTRALVDLGGEGRGGCDPTSGEPVESMRLIMGSRRVLPWGLEVECATSVQPQHAENEKIKNECTNGRHF